MKKYFVLTSILALCACHSGGGSHHDSYVPDPVEPAIEMPSAVQQWNKGWDNDYVADSGPEYDRDTFIFHVDGRGNISTVTLEGRKYNRNGDKNEYVYTEPNKTRTIELATLGKEAGLQFADFGYAQETELEPGKTDRDFYVFTGGQNPLTNPDVKDATFTGTAVAYIEADMPDRVANQVSKTDKATLVVDANGAHRLTMPFSQADKPWYDVVADKNGNIQLSNGANVAADFRVDGIAARDNYATHQFYGTNGVAEEVTYRVGAEYKDNATGREVDFDAAFGGKR